MAAAIERAAVFELDDLTPRLPAGAAPRFELCRRILDTNLQQLLAAAEELRDTAWQYDTRAKHLDGRPA